MSWLAVLPSENDRSKFPFGMMFFNALSKNIIPKGNFDLSFSLGRTANQDIVLCPGNHLGYLKAMGIYFPSPIDWLNIFLDRKAYRKSKLILACSEMMKHELIGLFKVDAKKIRVLLPPIDVARFNQTGKKNKQKLRTKYGFSESKISLLFLTTGNKRKGYPFLLSLMNELRDEPIELIIAGVKPMHTKLPNVKYIGYSENSEELLWAADALIHPALYEPFGQVITESIQCGTPVLVSEMVGAKQIVTKAVGRVVKGSSTTDWRNAINDFAESKFEIPIDFAQNLELTTEQHCAAILKMVAELD